MTTVRELIKFLEGYCYEEEEVFIAIGRDGPWKVDLPKRVVIHGDTSWGVGEWSTKPFNEDPHIQADNDYEGYCESLRKEGGWTEEEIDEVTIGVLFEV